MTTEEKREAKNAYQRARRANNKEKARAYDKARYEANKEQIQANNKASYEKNKDAINARQRIKYQKNKEQEQARGVANYKSNKLPYNIVYCIPDYDGLGNNYAGVTDNPLNRMAQHRYKGVLNTSEWYELGKCDCRREALALEDAFHKLGYHGAKGYKSKVA